MNGDSFNDFVGQGPILRLLITTVFFGVLWLALMVWIGYRANERRRREREGLPPLPNFLSQAWSMLQNNLNNNKTPASSYAAATGGDFEMPLPDLNALTSGLPEPELDSLLTPIETPEVVRSVPESRQVEEVVEAVIVAPVVEAVAAVNEVVTMGAEPRRSEHSAFVPESGEIPVDAVEVMRVWRDVSDGALIIQMGDKLFQTVPEMRDRGMAKRFINLVKDLARMAQAGAQASGLELPNFEATSAVISPQGAWANKRPALEKPVSLPVSKVEALLTGAAPDLSGAAGIAEQIEELLQFRLGQTPIFQQRSIHVRPNFDGSLRIQVDGRFYEHVDEVVDVDVREFLQGVIREWEARQ